LKNVDLSIEALRINNDEETANDYLSFGSDDESDLYALDPDEVDQRNVDLLSAADRQAIDQMFAAVCSQPTMPSPPQPSPPQPSLPLSPTHELHVDPPPGGGATDYATTDRESVWDWADWPRAPDLTVNHHRMFRQR